MASSKRHPETGKKLIDAEGLGQLIVRSGIQRVHLILVLGSGADDDDRHSAEAADFFNDIHTIHIRQS